MRRSSVIGVLMVCLVAALLAGCEPATTSPNARPDIVEQLRLDLTTQRHPSDGKGRVVLTQAPEGGAVAGGRARYGFRFEVAEEGIATGGAIYFQVHPFWGWSTPQTSRPDRPGYTEVTALDPHVELEVATIDQQLLLIKVTGRALVPGDAIHVLYGAGAELTQVDRYAEETSPFWFAVDGNGDEFRGLLPDPVVVPIRPREARRFVVRLPSRVRAGDEVELSVAAVDVAGNFVSDWSGEVRLERIAPPEIAARGLPAGLTETVVVENGSLKRAWSAPAVSLEQAGGDASSSAGAENVFRLLARSGDLVGVSNPMLVTVEEDPILWGDLHGHSVLSDGTGTPEDFYRYARLVSALDVAALTDHDHWGMEPLATHEEMWHEILRATEEAHVPDKFVTVLGYEWTSWLHGHRHVLYFDSVGDVLSAVDEEYETPSQLWRALAGKPAMTFAHHTAGDPVATNWDYPPDPVLEPVTEVVSVHGSSESRDSPALVRGAIDGYFVRDALDRGYVLGFLGSGDSHDGHPGLAHAVSPSGGLAAILAETRTREGVLEALRERRVYATNGPRIVLETKLLGRPMGSELEPFDRGALEVSVLGETSLERVDVVRSGAVVQSVEWAPGPPRGVVEVPLEGLSAGEYVYVRVLQRDGGAAWSSPYFIRR